ncbi:hypothetical protein LAG90_18705 [Marinilongibacter aquaticus]|uniref:hypothetical protein n=1 Tax=Marinilongibacter aquaticus TaxID=2975157 RepID=UPI0021BDEA41|nr:hypothetical protein [Marinilongibacter aquaticus]UBM58830.1 hypothetical protein LAG90_18705 [Marinilongibacter aquaticus]
MFFLHLLSLDVVFGAVFTSALFWRLPDGRQTLDYPSLILLGVTTWLIYILDRLLDLRIYPNDFSARHAFHAKYQFNLSVLSVALFIIALVLCFLIPKIEFLFGLGLFVLLLGYFIVLNKILKNVSLQWIKEPITAISYAIAVVGTAFVNKTSINLSEWVLGGMLFLVASQNLLIFSYFERMNHKEVDNSVSFYGRNTSLRLIRGIGMLVLFLGITLFYGGWEFKNQVAALLVVMSQILSFLPSRERFFLENDRYRWMGDGVFLLSVFLAFV